jgi:hypothetical protein
MAADVSNAPGLSAKDILRLLRQDIERAGSQSEWCRRHRVSRPHLNRVLRGRRKPFASSILKPLKIKTIYVLDRGESASTG